MKHGLIGGFVEAGRCLETIDPERRTHGTLDVQTLDLLPVLGQEGDEEVDGQVDVGDDLFLGHADVGDGNTHAKGFLTFQLELHGGLLSDDLLSYIFVGAQDGGKLAGLVQSGTQETRDLSNQGSGGQEGAKLLSKLLHQFLVLVHFLQLILVVDSDFGVLALSFVFGVSKNANSEFGTRNIWQFDTATESLILLRIIILEGHLEFNGLHELSLVLSTEFQEFRYGFTQSVAGNFTHVG